MGGGEGVLIHQFSEATVPGKIPPGDCKSEESKCIEQSGAIDNADEGREKRKRKQVFYSLHAFGAGIGSILQRGKEEGPAAEVVGVTASVSRSIDRMFSSSFPINTRRFNAPSSAEARMTCFVNSSHDKIILGAFSSFGGLSFAIRWISFVFFDCLNF